MSLAANIVASTNEDAVVLVDGTTYGNGESDREDVTVNFSGVDSSGNAITMPSYDEDTVESIAVPDLDDGMYTFTMTVVDGEETLTNSVDVFVYNDLLVCRDAEKAAYLQECCDGNVSTCDFVKLQKIELAIRTIEQQEVLERSDRVECIYNGIMALCQDNDCEQC